MKKRGKIEKIQAFFSVFVIMVVVSMVLLVSTYFMIRKQLQLFEEQKYHEKEAIVASYIGEYGEFANVYTEDDDTLLMYIDNAGNIVKQSENSNVSIAGDNLFKMLDKCDVYDASVEEAKALIVSGNEGRFEYFYSNQNRVLIYTPVGDGEHFLVRIVPTKSFSSFNNIFDSVLNQAVLFGMFLVCGMFGVGILMRKYVANMEKANARNDLIAEDNEMVSFVYYANIAVFELTGAVDKIFGKEISERGQIGLDTMSEMLHPEDRSLFKNLAKAIKEYDKRYTTEFRMIDRDGEYHWYRLNGKSLSDEHGNVQRFAGTFQNSDDQIVHENMLKNKAEHDLLTGLLNKITTEEVIDKTISAYNYSMFAFFIIDLDNFKSINDKLGHAVGDKVLKDVSSKLQLIFNENDVIGRLGGDEFAVLLVIPPTMTSHADKLIKEKATLANELLRTQYGDDDISIQVTASIGIARCPAVGNNFQVLYKCADKALYASKENGKNRYTFYSDIV